MDKATLDRSAQASINALKQASAAVKARSAKASVAPSSSASRVRQHVTGASSSRKEALIEQHLNKMPADKREQIRALLERRRSGEKITIDTLLNEGVVDEGQASELAEKVGRVAPTKKALPPPFGQR